MGLPDALEQPRRLGVLEALLPAARHVIQCARIHALQEGAPLRLQKRTCETPNSEQWQGWEICDQQGQANALDLLFLAMSYHRLGQAERARDCYDRANRWWQAQTTLTPLHVQELIAFRAEAAALLGLPDRPAPQVPKTPPPTR